MPTTAPTPAVAQTAPFVRLVLELGDANHNSKADLSGSLKVGPIMIVLPTIDVDFLDALPFLSGAFDGIRKKFSGK